MTPYTMTGSTFEYSSAPRPRIADPAPADTPRGKPTHDDKPAIVERSPLGYRDGMAHEVRIAPRWGNAITEYLRHLRSKDLAETTVYLRSYQLRTLSQGFRNRDPWTLTQADLEAWLAALGTARNTRRSMLTAIRGFYRYGERAGYVAANPCLWMDNIKMIPGEPRPASDAAIDAAVQIATPRVKLMIYLGAYMGLRRSEIASVHTTDIRPMPNGTYRLSITGKGRRNRLVKIPPLVMALLRECEPGWVFPSWHRGMVNSDGDPIDRHLSPGRVGELLAEVLHPFGVKPHELRHRFGSNLYEVSGHDLRGVQTALGHASVATTQIYTAIRNDALDAAIDRGARLEY